MCWHHLLGAACDSSGEFHLPEEPSPKRPGVLFEAQRRRSGGNNGGDGSGVNEVHGKQTGRLACGVEATEVGKERSQADQLQNRNYPSWQPAEPNVLQQIDPAGRSQRASADRVPTMTPSPKRPGVLFEAQRRRRQQTQQPTTCSGQQHRVSPKGQAVPGLRPNKCAF